MDHAGDELNKAWHVPWCPTNANWTDRESCENLWHYFIYSLIHPTIGPLIHLQPIHRSFHPSTHHLYILSIHSSIHLSFSSSHHHPSIYLPFHLPLIHPFTHPPPMSTLILPPALFLTCSFTHQTQQTWCLYCNPVVFHTKGSWTISNT